MTHQELLKLRPTPARVQLLADIDAGRVRWHDGGDWLYAGPDGTGRPVRKVTARVAELRAVQWVQLVHISRDLHRYNLTRTGRVVLAVARREAARDG